jgi:hypothetical protein
MRRQARLPIHLKYGQKPDLVAPPFPLSSKTGLILTAYIMYTVMKSIVMKDSLLFFTVTQVKGVEPISYVREPKLPHTIFVCVMFNFFNAKDTHLLRIYRHDMKLPPPPPPGRGFETTML